METTNNDFSFDNRVFINCPFDDPYNNLFYASIYTVLACGFYPISALQYNDGGLRLKKIYELVKGCRYGIHDLSMVSLDLINNLPRFNMPFELGIDFGCKEYGGGSAEGKRFLIFESSKYELKKYLSDLAGCDPVCHEGKPEIVIKEVRKWLFNSVSESDEYHLVPGEKQIQKDFIGFLRELPTTCIDMHIDSTSISYKNVVSLMKGWINRLAEKNVN